MDVRAGPYGRLSAEELMLLNCGVGEDLREPARLLCPLDSPGKNTGMGGHSFFQEIFPNQGSNPGLSALQVDSSLSEPLGKHSATT